MSRLKEMWDWLTGRPEATDPRMEAMLAQQARIEDVSNKVDRIHEAEAKMIRDLRRRGRVS